VRVSEASRVLRRKPYCSSSVVVDDLDLEGIPFAKLEADAPALVDGHCPPAFAVALELVQSDALQRAEVLQRFRDIQRQQQIGRRLEIKSAKMVRPLIVPDFPRRRVAPRPDHGNNILRQTVNIKRRALPLTSLQGSGPIHGQTKARRLAGLF